MGSVVGHDTDLMRQLTSELGENLDKFENLIGELYSLVDDFAGSEDFKGGLSQTFSEDVLDKKPVYQRYAANLKESKDFINKKATLIDDDTAGLTSIVKNGNEF